MKPPPRVRTKRTGEPEVIPERPKRSRKWTQVELRKLLIRLQKLERSRTADSPEGDIDYDVLQQSFRNRSISEISSQVESLKDKVISRISIQLQKWRLEEKTRKPIDEWTNMASALAGNLQVDISVAFSRMLTISSTEPCTLRNCDPSQVHQLPTDKSQISPTTSLRPMPHEQAEGEAPDPVPSHLLLKPPAPTLDPDRRLPTPSPVIKVPNKMCSSKKQAAASSQLPTTPHQPHGSIGPVKPGDDAAIAADAQRTEPLSSLSSSASASCSSQMPPFPSATNLTGLSHVPPTAPHSSTHPSAPLSSTTAALQTGLEQTNKDVTTDQPSTYEGTYAVDFERIYSFLSANQNPNEDCPLTPMESAIVLDLLMALPEELPLLDCRKLQKHLNEVYQCMSTTADTKIARKLLSQLKGKGNVQMEAHRAQDFCLSNPTPTTNSCHIKEELTEADGPSSGNHTTNQSQAVLLESCPPLNPFMVPIKLLQRRQHPELS
uniref:Small nuclear RNA activating complex, polypeptide 2, 45kDa n=1 Tax=Iconisemion striatum TaxID=60296 RepID=A0A1A7WX41_9TELE